MTLGSYYWKIGNLFKTPFETKNYFCRKLERIEREETTSKAIHVKQTIFKNILFVARKLNSELEICISYKDFSWILTFIDFWNQISDIFSC